MLKSSQLYYEFRSEMLLILHQVDNCSQTATMRGHDLVAELVGLYFNPITLTAQLARALWSLLILVQGSPFVYGVYWIV